MKNCAVEGCTRPVLAKNMCAAHYQRQRLGKDITKPIIRRDNKDQSQLNLFPVDPRELR